MSLTTPRIPRRLSPACIYGILLRENIKISSLSHKEQSMSSHDLYNLINELKAKLIETAAQKGMTHTQTIEISRQLDELIIECLKS